MYNFSLLQTHWSSDIAVLMFNISFCMTTRHNGDLFRIEVDIQYFVLI